MNVPSLEFLVFCAVVAALLAPSAAPGWRRGVLLVANLAFFATFASGLTSALPFVGFLALGYLAMRVVESNKNRGAFAGILVVLVVAFCWLKRYAFFPDSTLLVQLYVTVGLSYVFFRVASLVVDTFQNAVPGGRVGIVDYVNYALNFTTFVAGPIQLYRPFLRDEVERPAPVDAGILAGSVERIVLGFFKVTIISPLLFFAHERVLAWSATPLSAGERVVDAALMLAIFPVYVYFNFSGYTDVAIGAARFLRFELPENFNQPFLSRGFLEFWNRWHMSLSNWFKTYVYSPFLLASMRRFPDRSVEPLLGVAAYFVTFFLMGVWHGQTAMFLAFGLLNGLGVSGNKLFQIFMIGRLGRANYRALCDRPAYAAVSSGLTFLWLAIVLVFFWSSWSQLVNLAATAGPGTIVLACLAVIVGFAIVYWLRTQAFAPLFAATSALAASGYVRTAWYAALAVAVVSVAVVLQAPAAHVIYRAF
ncbi:MAG: hypothetical protein JO199_04175 [Candidatus Eremiobacteraeota bacterium]|nr:hypothetical protein [Candidatus Eremiobacteraeota bacterium]